MHGETLRKTIVLRNQKERLTEEHVLVQGSQGGKTIIMEDINNEKDTEPLENFSFFNNTMGKKHH